MKRDLRSAELNNLKQALAAFALQLNAFEARLKRRSFEPASTSSSPTASDIRFAKKILWAMKRADHNVPANSARRR
jgi:hypothetical protein